MGFEPFLKAVNCIALTKNFRKRIPKAWSGGMEGLVTSDSVSARNFEKSCVVARPEIGSVWNILRNKVSEIKR